MVNNVGKILDAGELKSIDHYKMANRKPMSYVRRYQSDYIQSLDLKEKDRLTNILDVDTKGLSIEEWCMNYYGVEKFNESWMLNVSPNWKGCVITRDMINFFIAVIELFFENCNRFTKMSYVLENGHGKEHLHAHIVFTLNTKKPGYMTSIKKGNILQEFRNCWNRLMKDNPSMESLTRDDEWFDPEGSYCSKRKKQIGLVDERCALQTCLITKQEMLKDKLDYLIEDLKPESHKNDVHHLCPVKGSKGYE